VGTEIEGNVPEHEDAGFRDSWALKKEIKMADKTREELIEEINLLQGQRRIKYWGQALGFYFNCSQTWN